MICSVKIPFYKSRRKLTQVCTTLRQKRTLIKSSILRTKITILGKNTSSRSAKIWKNKTSNRFLSVVQNIEKETNSMVDFKMTIIGFWQPIICPQVDLNKFNPSKSARGVLAKIRNVSNYIVSVSPEVSTVGRTVTAQTVKTTVKMNKRELRRSLIFWRGTRRRLGRKSPHSRTKIMPKVVNKILVKNTSNRTAINPHFNNNPLKWNFKTPKKRFKNKNLKIRMIPRLASNGTSKGATARNPNVWKSTVSAFKLGSLATIIANVWIVRMLKDAMSGGVS